MSETVHIDFGVSKDCINHDSYGEICVQCNCCGRFNKETMWECRYNMYWQHLAETIEDHSFNYLQSNLQQSNIAKNVIYYGEKILECVSHIVLMRRKEQTMDKLLINNPKSNNSEDISNKQIEVITYEEDRLNYFTELMKKAQKRYLRLFKKYKNAPYLSEESQMLSDAGREAQFHGDVVEMLEKGYRRQSEWISVEERLPECEVGAESKAVLFITSAGFMYTGYYGCGGIYHDRYFRRYHDAYEGYDISSVTHWMPLPEAPKKGGAE